MGNGGQMSNEQELEYNWDEENIRIERRDGTIYVVFKGLDEDDDGNEPTEAQADELFKEHWDEMKSEHGLVPIKWKWYERDSSVETWEVELIEMKAT